MKKIIAASAIALASTSAFAFEIPSLDSFSAAELNGAALEFSANVAFEQEINFDNLEIPEFVQEFTAEASIESQELVSELVFGELVDAEVVVDVFEALANGGADIDDIIAGNVSNEELMDEYDITQDQIDALTIELGTSAGPRVELDPTQFGQQSTIN